MVYQGVQLTAAVCLHRIIQINGNNSIYNKESFMRCVSQKEKNMLGSSRGPIELLEHKYYFLQPNTLVMPIRKLDSNMTYNYY